MALPFSEIKDSEALVVAYLKERHPDLDLSKGTGLRDTFVKLAATGLALIRDEAKKAKESFSLKRVLEGEDIPDASIVDNTVSNWFVYRNAGAKASGYIRIEVAVSKSYLVPKGLQFTINGKQYLSLVQASITPGAQSGLAVLHPSGHGTFYFLVPIEAEEIGAESNALPNTVVEVSQLDNAVLAAITFTDISGGKDVESNKELVERAQQAITVRDLNTRKSIPFILRQEFPYITKVQAIGYGDPEMQRDTLEFSGQVIVNNVHFGGCVDIYVRTDPRPIRKVYRKVVDASGKVILMPPETPIYRVHSVALPSGELILDDLGFTYSPTGDINHRTTRLINSRFSSFEKLEISGLDEYIGEDVDVRVLVPERVSELQAFVDADENRVVACNSVVRAFIPVFVGLNVSYRAAPSVEVDEVGLAEAIAEYINNVDPSDDLKTSEIAAIAQRWPGVGSVQLPITLQVSIELPDGTSDMFTENNIIQIPNRPTICLSKNTVSYYCDATQGISLIRLP